MSTEKIQISNTVEKINNVLELFYQQKDKEAFDKFETVILEISKAVDELEQYKNKHCDFDVDEIKICNILTEAMNALQEKDNILMADILQYDFVEYLSELVEIMQ